MFKQYYIYILASRIGGTLYIGVTNDLIRRVFEHKRSSFPVSPRNTACPRLVYLAIFRDARSAIAREKQMKKWRRAWKIQLIEESNPNWVDLFPALSGGAG